MAKTTTDDWKHSFPTHDFEDKEALMAEYEFAAKALGEDERLFMNAANMTVLLVAGVVPFALSSSDKALSSLSPTLPMDLALSASLLLQFGFAALLLRYFADRHKSVVFASRKLIALRRMLGVRYGAARLVLPNWRIEGADEPLAIRMFPGWNTVVAFPCAMIAGGLFLCVFVTLVKIQNILSTGASNGGLALAVLGAVFASLMCCGIYRKALFDTHESGMLIVAKLVAWFLGCALERNFEQVIYRAQLARLELHRLKYDLTTFKKILVQIEDRGFYKHRGVSLRGLIRMILSILNAGRRSGGSTLTQQLVRTLFIRDLHKTKRRKVVEILLALWFDACFDKDCQIEIYAASVRFDRGTFGIARACKHFTGKAVKKPGVALSFLLVERLSNVRSLFLEAKVKATFQRLMRDGFLTAHDSNTLVDLYEAIRSKGLIQNANTSAFNNAFFVRSCGEGRG